MYDRRVVRGNTYAQHIIPTVSIKHAFYYAWPPASFAFPSAALILKIVCYGPPLADGSARPCWNAKTAGDQEEGHCSKTSQGAVQTQDSRGPAGPKTHWCTDRSDVSLHFISELLHLYCIQIIILWPLFSELYLEELSDVVVATDIECQTDAFLDKPATPLFIPAKSGKDVETQIEEGEVGDRNGKSGRTFYT